MCNHNLIIGRRIYFILEKIKTIHFVMCHRNSVLVCAAADAVSANESIEEEVRENVQSAQLGLSNSAKISMAKSLSVKPINSFVGV